MLEENKSLESISIFVDRGTIPVEEECALLTALQQNTKLKTTVLWTIFGLPKATLTSRMQTPVLILKKTTN
jgi:hypothetical protein